MEESMDMSTEDYKDIFYNIWSLHNNQIKVKRFRYLNSLADQLWTIDEYYLDPKWENLWI